MLIKKGVEVVIDNDKKVEIMKGLLNDLYCIWKFQCYLDVVEFHSCLLIELSIGIPLHMGS